LRLYRGTVAVQERLISQPAKGADLRSCLDGVHWDLTGTRGWLLSWCPAGLWPGHVHWVASLSLSCLGLGGALERHLRGWWVRREFSVDTECTAFRDYSFPVGLGNPAWALLCPVWLWDVAGVVWLCCSCGLSAACQVINRGDRKSFGELHSTCLVRACDLTGCVLRIFLQVAQLYCWCSVSVAVTFMMHLLLL